MAKVSMVERQKKRERLVAKYAKKREELKAIIANTELDRGERVRATMALAKLPRNSSTTRLHNRCQVSGRPKGYYRKLKMSRIALRELGNQGLLPGVVKSSW